MDTETFKTFKETLARNEQKQEKIKDEDINRWQKIIFSDQELKLHPIKLLSVSWQQI